MEFSRLTDSPLYIHQWGWGFVPMNRMSSDFLIELSIRCFHSLFTRRHRTRSRGGRCSSIATKEADGSSSIILDHYNLWITLSSSKEEYTLCEATLFLRSSFILKQTLSKARRSTWEGLCCHREDTQGQRKVLKNLSALSNKRISVNFIRSSRRRKRRIRAMNSKRPTN